MPRATNYLQKLKTRVNKRIKTREQALADTLYEFFGRKLEFKVIMGIIRNKGYQAVREIFGEVKQAKAKNPVALFLWFVKREKVEWKNGTK